MSVATLQTAFIVASNACSIAATGIHGEFNLFMLVLGFFEGLRAMISGCLEETSTE